MNNEKLSNMDVLSIKTAQKFRPNKVQFCSTTSENQFKQRDKNSRKKCTALQQRCIATKKKVYSAIKSLNVY